MIYGFAYLGMVLVISAGWVVLAVLKKPDFIEKPLEELKNIIGPLLNSKKLIIMTDQNGIFDKNPDQNKDAKVISKINLNNFNMNSISFGNSGIFGRGGMITKIKAAKDFLKAKKLVWILNGKRKNALIDLIQNQEQGTKIFLA